MLEVRAAKPSDAQAILSIYAPYVLNTAFSFETEIPTIEDFQKRIENCLEKYPWIVCVVDGSIAGYVYASKHRDRDAYQWTCECSVYLNEKFKGRGLGKQLYGALFQLLKMQGFRNIYAGITLPNDPSVSLHEKCGFELFATYQNIGYKFKAWHNVGWWRLQLNDYDLKPPPPIKFSQMDPGVVSKSFENAAVRIQPMLNG